MPPFEILLLAKSADAPWWRTVVVFALMLSGIVLLARVLISNFKGRR